LKLALSLLTTLGIVVFAVGILLVPLLAGIPFTNLSAPWTMFAFPLAIALEVLWFWAGIRYLIRPREPRPGKRVLATVLVFIALLTAHPWVFGLPGRISEFGFGQSLKREMPFEQVHGLAADLDGRWRSDKWNGTEVDFQDISMICYVSGLRFKLEFDQQDRLKSWGSEQWSDGC
jgi:hypothetical protein